MKNIAMFLLAAAVMALSTPAFAGSCPKLWKQVDSVLAGNPQVSADVMDKVKSLRAQGEADHKSGKHAQSAAALKEALQLLGQ